MPLYRQGDIVLKGAAALPERLKPVPGLVLARGEATGHAHQVVGNAALFRDPSSQRLWLQVMGLAAVVHDEHRAIPLALGVYEVIRQREYVPAEVRSGTFREVDD